MRQFFEFLQKDSLVSTVITIGGYIGLIVGLVSGWKPFISAMRGGVNVSRWVILILVFLWPVSLWIARNPKDPANLAEYEAVVGKDFGVEVIDIDGISFDRCRFTGSQLRYSGKGGGSLNSVQLNNCTYSFQGSALYTLDFLRAMYRDTTSRRMVNVIIEDIKRGTLRSEYKAQ